MPVCKDCKEDLPDSAFHRRKSKLRLDDNRLRTQCKVCQRAYQRERDRIRRESDPELYKRMDRDKMLRKKYGIGVDDYEKLSSDQNNGCAICGDVAPLMVDHCHDTGKVRGLLCHHCNTGLGQFKDNIGSLLRAIEYLSS